MKKLQILEENVLRARNSFCVQNHWSDISVARPASEDRAKHAKVTATLKSQAARITSTTCTLGLEVKKQNIRKKEKLILDKWENEVKGSARKTANLKRKRAKFTEEQKGVMEKCFDEGEYDKRKRYTTSSCQKLMLDKLGQTLVLTEKQIASYWSNYRKRKSKSAQEKENKKPKLK
ncbi:---NA--- [Paramuricea clavata]|uniref:---NA n=1 Tax=Paramuricea clavata TaxID=317549 RepID=A0A6S7K5G4_PARCT|nr:---NA--- [Paramuricea clavata]